MNEESIVQRVLHLREVENLSQRQIANAMDIGRKRVRTILGGTCSSAKSLPKKSVLDEYMQLITHWYKQYPRLKATQIYQRLKSYGYQGSYVSVVRLSRKFRRPASKMYHTLSFIPGEEAQIDWFFFNHGQLGKLAGFLYVLAYSRYAWGIFYPKTTFEFFLAGHLECFQHLNGLAHSHRYDNLKSVVLTRQPTIQYNPQFLDFSRFYGFSIYLCNPYKGNEKGRVERLIRDIRTFLYAENFCNIDVLNQKFQKWLTHRNNNVHRSTHKTPKELLMKERLISLPAKTYHPTRSIICSISKTALAEFETNRYSVPTVYTLKKGQIIAYPEKIEINIDSKKVATHRRSFEKNQLIQNPLHLENLLNKTPDFKMKRIRQLIEQMNPEFYQFLLHLENDDERVQAAYQLFVLLKTHSKALLTSAVRELNGMRSFKVKAIRSLLNLPAPRQGGTLWPKNLQLLNFDYKPRRLEDYDPTI